MSGEGSSSLVYGLECHGFHMVLTLGWADLPVTVLGCPEALEQPRDRSLATEYVLKGMKSTQHSLRGGKLGLQRRAEITRYVIGCLRSRGSGSLTFCISFRKRKGDEVDGLDQVPKKKPKKEKDKLEKALKVSSELGHSARFFPCPGKKAQGGVCVPYPDL